LSPLKAIGILPQKTSSAQRNSNSLESYYDYQRTALEIPESSQYLWHCLEENRYFGTDFCIYPDTDSQLLPLPEDIELMQRYKGIKSLLTGNKLHEDGLVALG